MQTTDFYALMLGQKVEETWHNCSLANALDKNQLHLPPDDYMPNDNAAIPFHFVADDACVPDEDMDDEALLLPISKSSGKDLQL